MGVAVNLVLNGTLESKCPGGEKAALEERPFPIQFDQRN
jgi:hypothetical protein